MISPLTTASVSPTAGMGEVVTAPPVSLGEDRGIVPEAMSTPTGFNPGGKDPIVVPPKPIYRAGVPASVAVMCSGGPVPQVSLGPEIMVILREQISATVKAMLETTLRKKARVPTPLEGNEKEINQESVLMSSQARRLDERDRSRG